MDFEKQSDGRIATTVSTGYFCNRSINVLKIPERATAVDGEGWLLVDDLVDTGTTAKKAREILPKSHFATVYAKPQGKPTTDNFVSEVPQDVWVFFPWDTEPQYIAPLVGS